MTAETDTQKINVGDFMVSSWGYDQTNIDFYKIVGVTASGKSVKLQKWTSATVESDSADFTSISVVPGDGPATRFVYPENRYDLSWSELQDLVTQEPVKPLLKKIHDYNGKIFVELTSYSSASLWSGRPARETATGYGH